MTRALSRVDGPDTVVDVTQLHVVRRHRWGVYLAALVILFLIAWAAAGMVGNPRFDWAIVGDYLFSKPILDGLLLTLELTAVCVVLGIVLGGILALMRLSGNPVLAGIGWGYAWVFRATPLLVQLIFWYNLGALYPRLGLGIPFGPTFLSGDATTLISPWLAAVIGLSLNEAAYMAEIIRGGVQSVDRGQHEAGTALGMPPWLTMRRIILPQALRTILPPTGNQVIGLLKMTSLVSTLALSDLLFTAQSIYARTFRPIPLLIVVVLWYLVVTSILMVLQYLLERRLARSDPARGVRGNPAQASVVPVPVEGVVPGDNH